MSRKIGQARERYSLRLRLLVGLFTALLILTGILFAFVSSYARRAADSAYDQLLLASALSIADSVRVHDGALWVDLPNSAFDILAMARRDRIFYRVGGPDGALITGYGDLPAPRAGDAGAGGARFEDAVYRGMGVRVAQLNRFIAIPGLSGPVSILVAQTREERTALADDILVNAFLPIALAILTGAGLAWFGVRRALAPLGTLERIIRDRQANDFSPIAMPPPEEVSQLVLAINQLMARLKANLDTMQMFLADAAHQIRTPLASLRLQAELAADEDDPQAIRRIAERIHRNAVHAGQLTNQLLNHAMVQHRGQTSERETVDLAALLMQVVQRAQVVATDTVIRLEVDELVASPTVRGDPISLREALTNLLDNAVKYGGGTVAVRLAAGPGGDLFAEVADRGPGIPDAEKESVLERFSRGSTAEGVSGSGLGLAIVRSVADEHGAVLRLLDRPGGGLAVRLEFPAAMRHGNTAPPAAAACLPAILLAGLPAVLLTALLMAASGALAAEPKLFPARGAEQVRLRIVGATDLQAMEPLLADFQRSRPEVAIEYTDTGTAELYAGVIGGKEPARADVLISSAVDLQVKLVNDGFTRPHRSEHTVGLPKWANWRDEAFGFTVEPAVIAYNRTLVPASDVPRTHEDLIRLLREKEGTYTRRIGTYDVRISGIGYLFATQDSLLFSQFWQLISTMGNAGVRLFCCTRDILDLVERGELLIAYNVLGSYAGALAAGGAPIGVVLPSDYTLAISRVAVIPKGAAQSQLAGDFIDYLLSPRGQQVVTGASGLSLPPPEPAQLQDALRPIDLGPALLVFLDRLKRNWFLQRWSSAIDLP